jgi:hypothetical protein
MDDYTTNLNDASITIFGEGFVEPYEHMKAHLLIPNMMLP